MHGNPRGCHQHQTSRETRFQEESVQAESLAWRCCLAAEAGEGGGGASELLADRVIRNFRGDFPLAARLG